MLFRSLINNGFIADRAINGSASSNVAPIKLPIIKLIWDSHGNTRGYKADEIAMATADAMGVARNKCSLDTSDFFSEIFPPNR